MNSHKKRGFVIRIVYFIKHNCAFREPYSIQVCTAADDAVRTFFNRGSILYYLYF